MPEDKDDEHIERAEAKGAFWGSFARTVLAPVVTAILAGGGIGWLQTKDTKADAEAAAKAEAEAQAKTAAKAVALYMDALRPEIEERFNAVDEDLEALDEDLDECLSIARDADKEAFAALLAIEMRFGRRTAERAVARAHEEEPEPPPSPDEPRVQHRQKAKLPTFQLKE